MRSSAELPINVMGSLVIGDPSNPKSAFSESAWEAFRQGLKTLKNAGFRAITTDIWWGLIEPQSGQFN